MPPASEPAPFEAGDAQGAAEAFNRDSKTYPLDGWSFHGLAQAQQKLGRADAARETSKRQATAW